MIHQKIKKLQDEKGIIERKDICSLLKYGVKIDKHIRNILIREMVELGLLKRINSQKYKWVYNKRSEKIGNVSEALKMAEFYKKNWWKDI